MDHHSNRRRSERGQLGLLNKPASSTCDGRNVPTGLDARRGAQVHQFKAVRERTKPLALNDLAAGTGGAFPKHRQISRCTDRQYVLTAENRTGAPLTMGDALAAARGHQRRRARSGRSADYRRAAQLRQSRCCCSASVRCSDSPAGSDPGIWSFLAGPGLCGVVPAA